MGAMLTVNGAGAEKVPAIIRICACAGDSPVMTSEGWNPLPPP
jgi:hypothetical protein